MLAESWLDLRVGIQQMNPNHFASDFGHFDSTIHIVVDCYCYATVSVRVTGRGAK